MSSPEMTATSELPSSLKKSSVHGISILSIDFMKPTERLSPGEPHQIAPGVTISILQSAAEALLEVEESAAGSISVDNHPASELATIRPGQIIKTREGRYVLIRHLQSMIVPRESGYQRPAHVQKMIELAVASVTEPAAQEIVRCDAAVASQATGSNQNKRNLRIALLGTGAAVMIGLCFLPTNQKVQTQAQMPVSKSRVIAAAESAQEQQLKMPVVDQAANATLPPTLVPASQPSQVQPQTAKTTGVEAPHPALASSPTQKRVKNSENSVPTTGKGVRLSEKDRQTIIEYKLEAKFDRNSARSKLRDFARSFPPGSPARAEADRALAGF